MPALRRLKEGKTTFTVDLGFGVVVVRDVPATVCSQCGADWIEMPFLYWVGKEL